MTMTQVDPNMPRLRRKVRRIIRKFVKSDTGIAATEFALILPIMLAMYFGTVELSQAIGHERKGALLARTLSDLVTQSSTISNTELTSIWTASTAILSPYAVDKLAMRITSYRIDATGKVFVDWSEVQNHNAGADAYTAQTRCADASAALPAELKVAKTSLVIAEVTLKHVPTIGYMLAPAGITMKETLPTRPRVSDYVGREGTDSTVLCSGWTP